MNLAELKTELGALLSAIQDRTDCLPHLNRLDAMRLQLDSALHPRLTHYLERRSYEKALAHLVEFPAGG